MAMPTADRLMAVFVHSGHEGRAADLSRWPLVRFGGHSCPVGKKIDCPDRLQARRRTVDSSGRPGLVPCMLDAAVVGHDDPFAQQRTSGDPGSQNG